jgi:3-oxoacyl-[acyl-carrier protein] reductase
MGAIRARRAQAVLEASPSPRRVRREPLRRAALHSAVIPGLIEQNGGRLITIISDAGRVGEPGLEIYSAAKAGAAGFMRAVAKALGRYNVTANSVAIATTRTPTVAGMTENEELAKRVLKNYTIRRFGEPSDIAAMVLFLASDAAGWITGQTYPVNGGFSVAL